MGHRSLCGEDGAQRAFRCQGEAIVGGFAVDEEAAAFGRIVGDLGSGGVALFAGDKEQAHGIPSARKRFGGGDLGGDDPLGVADAAAVEEVGVFAEGEEGRNGIHMGGKNQVR